MRNCPWGLALEWLWHHNQLAASKDGRERKICRKGHGALMSKQWSGKTFLSQNGLKDCILNGNYLPKPLNVKLLHQHIFFSLYSSQTDLNWEDIPWLNCEPPALAVHQGMAGLRHGHGHVESFVSELPWLARVLMILVLLCHRISLYGHHVWVMTSLPLSLPWSCEGKGALFVSLIRFWQSRVIEVCPHMTISLLPENFSKTSILFPQLYNATSLTAPSEVWYEEWIRIKWTDEN